MAADERTTLSDRIMEAEHIIMQRTDALGTAAETLECRGAGTATRRTIAAAITRGRAWFHLPGTGRERCAFA
jgi:hypothetical protein